MTKFTPGQIVMTRAIADSGIPIETLLGLLRRHLDGDDGDLCPEDKKTNLEAIERGERVFSAYQLSPDVKIWIITEWDRSVTTILFPDDY